MVLQDKRHASVAGQPVNANEDYPEGRACSSRSFTSGSAKLAAVGTRGLVELAETDPSTSMETKKKKRSIANEELVQNKKEKKKNDDQETLTKHKKRKHLIEESVPCAEECTVEIANKKKKKKESKVKEEVSVETVPCAKDNDLSIDNEGRNQLEPKDEILYKPDKSKKKKTKDKKVVLLAEVDDNEDLQRLCPEKISTKKNKTKQSTAEEIVHQLEALSETIVSGIGDAHEKRKKKTKKQLKRVSVEEVHINLETNDETSCNTENSKKKNKKKRSKDKCIDPQAQTNLEPDDETSCQPENLKKKKKKKKLDLLEAQVEDNEGLQTLSAEKISTKKKKAIQSMAEQSAHQLPALSKTVVSVTEDVYEEKSKKTKKKKKKKQHEDEEKIQPTVPETEMENGECELDDHNLASINNKKKKKKRAHQAHDNITINNGTLSNKDTQDSGKSTIFNNMKRHMLDSTISNEIPKSKKKKNIKFKQGGGSEATECGGDVEVVSVKKGNTDEVEIDKMRRKALQDEVDRASGKVKDSHFGQWQTATFENPDQKNKFLRLMGGFKKFSPSSALSPAGTERPNQALSKTGEETLKQNLLSEFEKAIDLKQHRGIGLGFQPATNKTFYIDKTRSNSIKFDD